MSVDHILTLVLGLALAGLGGEFFVRGAVGVTGEAPGAPRKAQDQSGGTTTRPAKFKPKSPGLTRPPRRRRFRPRSGEPRCANSGRAAVT